MMYELEDVLLLLIFIVVISMIFIYLSSENAAFMALGTYALAAPTVGGGNKTHTPTSIPPRKLIVADNAKFVFDGNNMVHAITNKPHMLPIEFERGLRTLSWSVSNALPGKDIHIVLKNPNKVKKNEDIKNIPYFQQLINMSREFPAITYHLAYGHDTKKSHDLHHLKGRDDFLTLYLARHDGYIISQDRFRDFNKFGDIKPFHHFATSNGNIISREKINPRGRLIKSDKPTLGNHLKYKFISKHDLAKQPHISNGDIYADNLGENSYIYLLI